jgi:glutamine amidotransferase
MTRVVILDYGSGNLRSAQRALARAGADVTVTPDLRAAAQADGLVVPGVGAYAACMAGIDEVAAGPVIAERVAAGRPVLGICVGMQILFEYGEEHGVVTRGLGLLPGGVTRLAARRVPHMGWNAVDVPPGSALFAGVATGTRFYFVHSYAAQAVADLDAAGARAFLCTHDVPFVAAVEHGPLSATQFHPEKSADAGAVLLRNWVRSLVPARTGATA